MENVTGRDSDDERLVALVEAHLVAPDLAGHSGLVA